MNPGYNPNCYMKLCFTKSIIHKYHHQHKSPQVTNYVVKQSFICTEKETRNKNINITRMHSSRMRTVRCSDRLAGGGISPWGVSSKGGCLPRGQCLPRGWCLPGGVCPGGVCLVRVCISACNGGRHRLPWTDRHLYRTLPFRNYCCGR